MCVTGMWFLALSLLLQLHALSISLQCCQLAVETINGHGLCQSCARLHCHHILQILTCIGTSPTNVIPPSPLHAIQRGYVHCPDANILSRQIDAAQTNFLANLYMLACNAAKPEGIHRAGARRSAGDTLKCRVSQCEYHLKFFHSKNVCRFLHSEQGSTLVLGCSCLCLTAHQLLLQTSLSCLLVNLCAQQISSSVVHNVYLAAAAKMNKFEGWRWSWGGLGCV